MALDARSDAVRPRRVGRPRKLRGSRDGDVWEEILSAAAALFEELGYAGTTTRKIAAQVGLQQGSIFHYFERKADILSELLYRTMEPALGFVEALDELDAPPEKQ